MSIWFLNKNEKVENKCGKCCCNCESHCKEVCTYISVCDNHNGTCEHE